MIRWSTGALELVLTHSDGAPVRLVGLGAPGRTRPTGATQPLVDVLLTGDGRARTGPRLTDTGVGRRLRHASHRVEAQDDDEDARVLLVVQRDEATGLEVSTRFTGGPHAAAVRAVTTLRNTGGGPLVLEAVSTLATGAVLPAGTDPLALRLHTGRSEQVAEFRWSAAPLFGNTGLADSTTDRQTAFGRGAVVATSTSSWSTARHLPTAVLEHPDGPAFAWQVEHSGGWRWEVGDVRTGEDALAVVLTGPTDLDHQWVRRLAPGESFTTVPASVAVSSGGGFDGVIAELTRHRRWLRRRSGTPVETEPLLVFNDYMNTLDGDPTTERLLPLVAAAADAGCEAFCIDAGWYDDTGRGFEAWWRSVGEWVPSTTRFPGGIERVLGEITGRGMRAGLWLEPEVVGVESPVAAPEAEGGLPDAAFLQRYGRRVHDDGRYFLDLRQPAALAHLDACVDRLVGELGVSYVKLDFNVTPGPGTDVASCSAGDGLLQHQRAHLAWLRGVRSRHPHLVVENCASGAMRADFALLELLDLQSTTDQEDFRLYPPIAAGAPAQVLPEQCGNWAYPQAWMSREEVAFTQVTGLAGRLYQAGRLDQLDAGQLSLVHAATALWKDDLRHHLVRSAPLRPLVGLEGRSHPEWDGGAVALGLVADGRTVVAVWHRGEADAEITLELPGGAAADLVELYPRVLPTWTSSRDDDGDASGGGCGRVVLRPGVTGPSARLYELQTR